jgi:integrase
MKNSRLAQKRNKIRQKQLARDVSLGKGFHSDMERWLDMFLGNIELQIKNDEKSKNTLRSYLFFKKSMLVFVEREFNINDGLEALNEDFINEYLDWVSRYKYSSKYGSEEYLFDLLSEFIDYAKRFKNEDSATIVNEYAKMIASNTYSTQILEVINEFDNFAYVNKIKVAAWGETTIDRFMDYVKEQDESGWSQVAKKTTMKQRKAILTSFLTYISINNNQKYDFTTLFKYIHKYTTKTTILAKRSYTDDLNDIGKIDRMLRQHIASAEPSRRQKRYVALRDSSLSLIMLYGGLRFMEAVALRFDDVVDIGDETYEVMIRSGKGRKSGKVPIYKPLIVKELEELKSHGYEYLSATHSGQKMDYGALYRSVKKVFDKNGMIFKGLHAFRHTFATEIAKQGDIMQVAELLRHTNIKTSQIYIKVSDKRAKETALDFQKKSSASKS